MHVQRRYIVFSDLDGTLLSHDTYSWEGARPALEVLKRGDIPLVLCSSKTKAEIEVWRRRLGNEHPFISENGGAIFIPVGYRGFQFKFDAVQDGYWVLTLGTDYPTLVRALGEIRARTGLNIRGFSDMREEEVAEATGLGPEDVRLARKRQYDEPFIVEGGVTGLREAVKDLGLTCTEGGRFFHLSGNADKGVATTRLTEIYRENCSGVQVVAIGIGDSLNDLPMLEAVDIPVLVKRPDGGYDERVNVEGLIRAEAAGPKGWNDALLKLVA